MFMTLLLSRAGTAGWDGADFGARLWPKSWRVNDERISRIVSVLNMFFIRLFVEKIKIRINGRFFIIEGNFKVKYH